MKKLLYVLLILICFFVGCKNNSPVIEKDKGVASRVETSKYIVRFENIKEDGKFITNHLWLEDEKTKEKKEIKIDLTRPIKNLYQRNFTGEGFDEILVVEEPLENGKIFEFRVYEIDKDYKACERFKAKGSMSLCEYWFLTEDNNLIHLNSLRDYSKEENAIYKSKFEAITYKPEWKNNQLEFKKIKEVKTKAEMDNMNEIREVLSVPKNALVISNVTIE